VRYLIADAAFGGGQYFINAQVLDENGTSADILWQGARFYVPMSEERTGTVFARVEVDPAPTA